jgi:hypothetical protein
LYAADHIRRVTTFGVFSGIGEFTVHKGSIGEIAGGGQPHKISIDRRLQASWGNRPRDHYNDVDTPFTKPGGPRIRKQQLKDLFCVIRQRDHLGSWSGTRHSAGQGSARDHRSRAVHPGAGAIDLSG